MTNKKDSQIINGFNVRVDIRPSDFDDGQWYRFSVGDLVMVDGGYFDNGIPKLGVVEERRASVFPLYNIYVFEEEVTYTALHENEISAI
jgi:hypothetical protein